MKKNVAGFDKIIRISAIITACGLIDLYYKIALTIL